ncbi:hypothetical protein H9P43_007342 [Blastocladiella emersonii ATCC 22665]|nr:hypothetical protein H9P43_007342 [Blastocladiella emersonii ATCC 22665]
MTSGNVAHVIYYITKVPPGDTHAAVGKLIVAMRATKVVPVPLFNKQDSQSSNIGSTESRAMICMILFEPLRVINELTWSQTLDLFKNTLEQGSDRLRWIKNFRDYVNTSPGKLIADSEADNSVTPEKVDLRRAGGAGMGNDDKADGEIMPVGIAQEAHGNNAVLHEFLSIISKSDQHAAMLLMSEVYYGLLSNSYGPATKPEADIDAVHDGDPMQVDGEPQQQQKKRASKCKERPAVSRTRTDANIGHDQWLAFDSVFILVQQMRQSGDAEFLNVLQDLRNCNVLQRVIEYIRSCRADVVLGQHPERLDDWSDQLLLITAQNSVRDAWNTMAAAKHARRLGLQPDEIFDLDCIDLVRKPSATALLLWRQLVILSSG